MPGFPDLHRHPEFAQTHVHLVGNPIQPSCLLSSLLLLPSIFPSIRVFSKELALPIKWPNFSFFSFVLSPSNEYSGFISFRIDWFDCLDIQAALKSLPQHHSSKASILQCSAFFIVQFSHSYMATGKTIALTIWTIVSEVLSLLLNMLSKFVIAFLSRSNFMAAFTISSDFGAQENNPLQWECLILTTGTPGKSPLPLYFTCNMT